MNECSYFEWMNVNVFVGVMSIVSCKNEWMNDISIEKLCI